jgi:hypothetical protein
MTGKDDLKELAINLQAAIAKARALNLPTSYLPAPTFCQCP